MKTDSQYEFLDAGAGRKLERFGQWVLSRPCAQAVWSPQQPDLWRQADASFSREHGAHWEFRSPRIRDGWTIIAPQTGIWNELPSLSASGAETGFRN